MQNEHSKIFWFCLGVTFAGMVFLAALIWIPVPQENQSMANIAIGFITGTVIFVPISYLLGGNIPQPKKDTTAGTTTADISATITQTDNKEDKTNG